MAYYPHLDLLAFDGKAKPFFFLFVSHHTVQGWSGPIRSSRLERAGRCVGEGMRRVCTVTTESATITATTTPPIRCSTVCAIGSISYVNRCIIERMFSHGSSGSGGAKIEPKI